MPAMQAGSIGVALDDDALGVVEQNLPRHAAEVVEGIDQSIATVDKLLSTCESHERGAIETRRRHERE